jgi:hypothetical protein
MRARESNFNRPLVYPKIRNFVFVPTCEMRPDFVFSEASVSPSFFFTTPASGKSLK